MASRGSNPDQIGGIAYTVGDAYLWATIYYLDSVTNYRECIAQNAAKESLAKDNPAKPVQEVPHRSMRFVTTISLVVIVLAFIIAHEFWPCHRRLPTVTSGRADVLTPAADWSGRRSPRTEQVQASSPADLEPIEKLKRQLQYAQPKIQLLEERMHLLQPEKYGPSGEKLPDAQLELFKPDLGNQEPQS